MTHAATESAGTAVEVDPRLTPVARAVDLHKVYGAGTPPSPRSTG